MDIVAAATPLLFDLKVRGGGRDRLLRPAGLLEDRRHPTSHKAGGPPREARISGSR
ncbi:hypothetical protein OG912_36520 [Streptomyces sp. NBC_00464]|uniref:hypothetical protein n=1 Tax=Streptomyces sp. NBC_00464 TaxID=2975751 RepID=UPI002E19D33D